MLSRPPNPLVFFHRFFERRSGARRERRMALALGALDPAVALGPERGLADAAVDLNLPLLLESLPWSALRRPRAAPALQTERQDPRPRSWSLLHEAAYRCHLGCVSALLRRGAPARARACGGLEPLRSIFLFSDSAPARKHPGGCPAPEHELAMSDEQAARCAGALLSSGAAPSGGELCAAAFLGWGAACETLLSFGASARDLPDAWFPSPLSRYCVERLAAEPGANPARALARLSELAPIPLVFATLSNDQRSVLALAARASSLEIAWASAFAVTLDRPSMCLLLLGSRPEAAAQPALEALCSRAPEGQAPAANSLAAWLVKRGADPWGAHEGGFAPHTPIERCALSRNDELAAFLLALAPPTEEQLSLLASLVEHPSPWRFADPQESAARQNRTRALVEGQRIALALSDAAPQDKAWTPNLPERRSRGRI